MYGGTELDKIFWRLLMFVASSAVLLGILVGFLIGWAIMGK